jgi:hypothetical protein
MKIDNQLHDTGSSDYYDQSFRNTLEAHLTLLRASAKTTTITVPEHTAGVYNQDLFGFLQEAKVPVWLHWLTMRLNNFFSPMDFGPACTSLLIPNSSEVDILRQSWKTKATISS